MFASQNVNVVLSMGVLMNTIDVCWHMFVKF